MNTERALLLTSGVVEDHAGEVVHAEGSVHVRLGLQVVDVVAMRLVQLVQHRLVGALEKAERGLCSWDASGIWVLIYFQLSSIVSNRIYGSGESYYQMYK